MSQACALVSLVTCPPSPVLSVRPAHLVPSCHLSSHAALSGQDGPSAGTPARAGSVWDLAEVPRSVRQAPPGLSSRSSEKGRLNHHDVTQVPSQPAKARRRARSKAGRWRPPCSRGFGPVAGSCDSATLKVLRPADVAPPKPFRNANSRPPQPAESEPLAGARQAGSWQAPCCGPSRGVS